MITENTIILIIVVTAIIIVIATWFKYKVLRKRRK
jgi:hypothetical protein